MDIEALITKAAEGDAEAKTTLMKLADREVYLQGELDKAIKARDRAKADGRLSEDERKELETLKASAAEAEDAKLKAEGKYQELEQRLNDRVAKAEANVKAADERLATQQIELAFHSAPTLFGKDGRTILTPDLAIPILRDAVKFVPGENGDRGSIVVYDQKGEPILGKDGKPAPFAEAMEQVIDSRADKATLLRGSGRAGSGTPGSGEPIPVSSATRADLARRAATGDQEAIKALEAHPVPGTVQSGPGFARFRQSATP